MAPRDDSILYKIGRVFAELGNSPTSTPRKVPEKKLVPSYAQPPFKGLKAVPDEETDQKADSSDDNPMSKAIKAQGIKSFVCCLAFILALLAIFFLLP